MDSRRTAGQRNSIEDLEWLNDAPLYIDASTISAFYDAVVNPEHEVQSWRIEFTESKIREISGKLGLSGEAQLILRRC